MCLVSSPAKSGHLCTRTFIPKVCHQAIGVLGAVSVATAALFEGSAIHDLADIPEGYVKSIEHPSGHLDVQLELNPYRPDIDILRAGLRIDTADCKGEVFIPASDGKDMPGLDRKCVSVNFNRRALMLIGLIISRILERS